MVLIADIFKVSKQRLIFSHEQAVINFSTKLICLSDDSLSCDVSYSEHHEKKTF